MKVFIEHLCNVISIMGGEVEEAREIAESHRHPTLKIKKLTKKLDALHG